MEVGRQTVFHNNLLRAMLRRPCHYCCLMYASVGNIDYVCSKSFVPGEGKQLGGDLVHDTRVSWIFLCGCRSELQGCLVFSQTVSSRKSSCFPLTTTIFGLELLTVTSIGTVVAGLSEAFRPGRCM